MQYEFFCLLHLYIEQKLIITTSLLPICHYYVVLDLSVNLLDVMGCISYAIRTKLFAIAYIF